MRPEVDTIPIPSAQAVTYGTYLKVHELLALQQPLSAPPQHDETLFIIIHQAYELWFKQILHEVGRAQQVLEQDQLLVFKRILERVLTIQKVLTHQVDILETMTPVDFNTFRERLNPASGFQSYQFREFETRLGLKDQVYLKFHRHDPKALAALTAAMEAPSLYQRFLAVMARRGFAIPAEVLVPRPTAHESHPSVREAILEVYRNSDRYYDFYATMESLIDLDEGLLLWRYRHVAMVERMIGSRKGTGGSSGVKYLSGTLQKRFFPEIWEVRSFLGESEYGQRDERQGSGQSSD